MKLENVIKDRINDKGELIVDLNNDLNNEMKDVDH